MASASLVPQIPYNRCVVACMVPENNPTLRNLASVAIGKMVLQGYVNDAPRYVGLVNGWLSPKSSIGLPSAMIKEFFQSVLLTREQTVVPTTR